MSWLSEYVRRMARRNVNTMMAFVQIDIRKALLSNGCPVELADKALLELVKLLEKYVADKEVA